MRSVNMTSGYKISPKGRKSISSAMKKDYAGPRGSKLRAIDSENGKKMKGHTYKRTVKV